LAPRGATRQRIHRFWGRIRSRDAALDLAAETFAQAWISRGRFRDLAGGSAGPWLFTIARRVLIGSVRRQRLELRALDELRLESVRADTAAQPDESWLAGSSRTSPDCGARRDQGLKRLNTTGARRYELLTNCAFSRDARVERSQCLSVSRKSI
jgi:DNA-directed RNA polymerase specialized sigma24 family protein